jgi:septation ring formation regulator EzrA
MSDELRAIEADFEALVEHLADLIELHEKNPDFIEQVEQLRAARVKAIEGAERVRQNRDPQS